jgi:hypothetical protein
MNELEEHILIQQELINKYQQALDEIYNLRIANAHLAVNRMHLIARDTLAFLKRSDMNIKEARIAADIHSGLNGFSAIGCPCNKIHGPTRKCWESIGFLQGYSTGVEGCIQILNDYPDISVEDLARIKINFYKLLDRKEEN